MINKIILDKEVEMSGRLIGIIIPLGTYFNKLILETKDYIIIDWNEVSSGYYPIVVQSRTIKGEYTTTNFQSFNLKNDLITKTHSVNAEAPSDIILLIETKQLMEV